MPRAPGFQWLELPFFRAKGGEIPTSVAVVAAAAVMALHARATLLARSPLSLQPSRHAGSAQLDEREVWKLGSRNYRNVVGAFATPSAVAEARSSRSGQVRRKWMVPVQRRAGDTGEQDLSSRHGNTCNDGRFFFGQIEALDSGRCQVRSGHGKSSHLGSSPPEGERARERAGEQWLEPHGSVRLDIVDMMDMVVSLVCACVRIGEHLDLLDGTKQNQGGGQVWTGLAATAANGSGCAWCMARMGRGDMPMRGLPRRTISGGLAARGGGVPLASCERSWAYQ